MCICSVVKLLSTETLLVKYKNFNFGIVKIN